MFDSQLISSKSVNIAASRTWKFNVTGFSLPVAMAFSTEAAVRAQVLDVLEQQGRAAGLPDFVITTILSQLGINVLYTPLPCPVVFVNPDAPIPRDPMAMMSRTTCVIFGNTVTTTCLGMGVPGVPAGAPLQTKYAHGFHAHSSSALVNCRNSYDVQRHHGALEQGMWQSVVNRVLRMITSGPFGTQFATAVATVT
ncbi:hypothetical protein KIN20_007536 [Parelaphostrongylus tenuis]|uniref:Uncharacterized protein n=1 Tax=Parelaphostrongylus tenuis TaxID=148309 RepID=A0AAD5M5N4_PARTN|nr:hypothetical protein KIN20_007536 [Parelaphostrongylus tenuis]